MQPPFKFGTAPYGSTETNLMTHYPHIYSYMKQHSKANAIEGVRAVKDGSVIIHSPLYSAVQRALQQATPVVRWECVLFRRSIA